MPRRSTRPTFRCETFGCPAPGPFSDQPALLRHRAKAHLVFPREAFQCGVCQNVSLDRDEAEKHVLEIHMGLKSVDEDGSSGEVENGPPQTESGPPAEQEPSSGDEHPVSH